jgi:predicted DNA-binding transcriptional regulator YafY
MRADRLLWLLLSLQVEGRLTAQALASRFEVSERTIYRDVEALAVAGVPIYTQTGAQGGIFLDEKYRTSLTGFTTRELHSLFVAADHGPLEDLGLATAIEGTSLKLFAALPSVHQHEVQRLRQRFYIDSSRWFDYSETPSLLPDLQQAVWEDRQITVTYRNYTDVTRTQTLDAYALVAKASVWYLVARTADGAFRTYRAARIAALTLLDSHFERDTTFDPVLYWKVMSQDFQRMREMTFAFYPVLLEVTAAAFDLLREHVPERFEQVDEPDPTGWLTVRVLFLSQHEACMNVLGLGIQARVLEPPELQQAILEIATSIINTMQPASTMPS